jgi:hypothetical protein
MNKKIVISLIVLVGLILNFKSLLASKVPGYIILNSSDTLFGEIKVSRFDSYTGDIVILGIHLEPFHSSVMFRETGNRHFKSYTPKDLIGFGFVNKTVSYRFKAFVMAHKSMVKSDRESLRFLSLIYEGEISVYRDIVRKENYSMKGSLNEKVIDYYDYYLFNNRHGLKKVNWSKDYNTPIDLLLNYEIDQKFIEKLPSNVRFENIVDILQEYEKWKVMNSTMI